MDEVARTSPVALQRRVLVPGSATEEKMLATLVERIRARCSPQQVYLFGSRAQSTAQDDSDIDLLVVLPEEQATGTCWDALLDATAGGPVGVDVTISTPNELAWRSQVPGFVEFAAVRCGRILYG